MAGPALLACSFLLLSCHSPGGGPQEGGQGGGPAASFQVVPAVAVLYPGGTVRFSCTPPMSQPALWTVAPAEGGMITPDGLFTAAGTPGQYSVQATWNSGSQGLAASTLTILSLPRKESSPDVLHAGGAQQTSSGGALRNGGILGEPYLATAAQDASGTILVRHGFCPPPATSTPSP